MPIQDHLEMGFSGQTGRGNLTTLIAKLQAIPYYPELFTWAYGDNRVTETRMQSALAQFVRSIQSFDSKYDAGRAITGNDQAPFPNFSAVENQGKTLFLINHRNLILIPIVGITASLVLLEVRILMWMSLEHRLCGI
jgi:cytochrome c peroxidase